MSRLHPLAWYLFAIVCLSGCTLSDNVWWTSISEPAHYPAYWENKCQQRRFRELARDALGEAQAVAKAETDDYIHEPFTVDQERGFEDGFVDYLIAGGTGNAPPLPPRRYWKAKYQTTQGQFAVQQWFRGYEHGAAVAEASGLRSLVTVPASDLLKSNTEPYYLGQNSSHRSKEYELEELTPPKPSADAARRSAAAPSPIKFDKDIISRADHEALQRPN